MVFPNKTGTKKITVRPAQDLRGAHGSNKAEGKRNRKTILYRRQRTINFPVPLVPSCSFTAKLIYTHKKALISVATNAVSTMSAVTALQNSSSSEYFKEKFLLVNLSFHHSSPYF